MTSRSGNRNIYLYFTVFSSGMTCLAIEFAASRLLGNTFGTSNLVWASIIGLILIYLTIGYFIGGYWADRSPKFQTMYTVLAWGAFTAGLVPFFARPVLRMAADAFDQLRSRYPIWILPGCIDPSHRTGNLVGHHLTLCDPSCNGRFTPCWSDFGSNLCHINAWILRRYFPAGVGAHPIGGDDHDLLDI